MSGALPLKIACLILLIQSMIWVVSGPYRILTDDHTKPDYDHDHEECATFVVLSVLLSVWYTSNIILIVATKQSLTETTWAMNLLGLPPALLALVAILMASFAVITYANHDEVTFQSLFELGCGLALFTITAYCFTYVSKGIQFPWIRKWLLVNGIFLAIYAYTLHTLELVFDKYLCYTALILYTFGYFNLGQLERPHQS